MPKVIDHAAREIAIAEAAWEVLRSRGIRSLSVRNVAAQADLAVGSLRRSFPTQRSLVRFCLELVLQRGVERFRALPVDLDAREFAWQACTHVLPLDEDRRVEMEVWLALSISALADPQMREECTKSEEALRQMCVIVIGRLDAVGLLAGSRSADSEPRRLHALLDGLALQLIRQGPGDPCDWALDVLQDHLEQLTGAAAGFRDMRDPGH